MLLLLRNNDNMHSCAILQMKRPRSLCFQGQHPPVATSRSPSGPLTWSCRHLPAHWPRTPAPLCPFQGRSLRAPSLLETESPPGKKWQGWRWGNICSDFGKKWGFTSWRSVFPHLPTITDGSSILAPLSEVIFLNPSSSFEFPFMRPWAHSPSW